MPLEGLLRVERILAATPEEVDRVALPRSKSESLFDDPLVDELALAAL
jgi:hypothetical protein